MTTVEANDEPIHRALGLTDGEATLIEELLGRAPNHLELAMYAVMWSEHCSYKSSRRHLGRLPTEGAHVLVGPGENAGVVDVGDGLAAAIRIESHNHPSYIEPHQGAATGVGGILRDIFTMGARPIAVTDPLRFGPLDDARSRWVAEGVVSGISSYGNSVGVPTVGGETVFDETYRGNPLVNVCCLGILPTEQLVLGQASGPGNLAVLLGSGTGRDGIGGVSVLASAGFSEDGDDDKRPAVQAGDPYEEKRLIEACLELLGAKLAVGIQDLGGAGLACATSETASRGGVGMDVWIDQVHRREEQMEPFEVMTSESQERMLAIVTPDDLAEVVEICDRWEVTASVIGEVTDDADGTLRLFAAQGGELLAHMPAPTLHDDAPLLDRPIEAPSDLESRRAVGVSSELDDVDPTVELHHSVTDTSWVWSQYDHQLFNNTVVGPGSDAAVLKLRDPATGVDTGKGLALTSDGNHLWCSVDPERGTAHTVAESLANLAVVGARPLALVNCLNFGNPEHPQVMWQLSGAIDGMTMACEAFSVPVIGGNVSLYNETEGVDIDPTPVVAMLGIVDRLERRPPGPTLSEGGRLVMLGAPSDELSGSAVAARHGLRSQGALPELDAAGHMALCDLVRELVVEGSVIGAHDVSNGGLAACVAEMAIASEVGVRLARIPDAAHLFSEVPSRIVLCVDGDDLRPLIDRAEAAGVPATQIGLATGDRIMVKGLLDVAVADLVATSTERLPNALGQGTAQV